MKLQIASISVLTLYEKKLLQIMYILEKYRSQFLQLLGCKWFCKTYWFWCWAWVKILCNLKKIRIGKSQVHMLCSGEAKRNTVKLPNSSSKSDEIWQSSKDNYLKKTEGFKIGLKYVMPHPKQFLEKADLLTKQLQKHFPPNWKLLKN